MSEHLWQLPTLMSVVKPATEQLDFEQLQFVGLIELAVLCIVFHISSQLVSLSKQADLLRC